MSYWESAKNFCQYNPHWVITKGLDYTVEDPNDRNGCWFACNLGTGQFRGGLISIEKYFRDWNNQTQKEWDMVCMLFNIPQVYVKP